MVTHNGERFIHEQCESIFRQTLLPGAIVVVDDASRDATPSLLAELRRSAPAPMEIVEVDSSDAADVKTRIAHNFARGLAEVARYDFVVLADQDDVWFDDRLECQRAALVAAPSALLAAGDGLLIDEASRRTIGTLRDTFPVPPDWATLSPAQRMRIALRQPLVTGAASALSQELARLMTPIPTGWLHDRWGSLVASARDGLVLQPRPVIEYRVHARQVLGRRQATTGAGSLRLGQLLARGAGPAAVASRARDVVGRLRPLALDDAVRSELSWRALLASSAERVKGVPKVIT